MNWALSYRLACARHWLSGVSLAVVASACLATDGASAQAPTSSGFGDIAGGASASKRSGMAPEFPDAPNQWLNGPPLALDALLGKGVVLYFFECSNSNTEKAWPKTLETFQAQADKPLIVVGINPVDPAPVVQQYLQKNKIRWPVLVDAGRVYERAVDAVPLSKENATQIRFIDSKGKVQRPSPMLDDTIAAALKDAAWTVEPKDIPDDLRGVWAAIELYGNESAVAAQLKKSFTAKQPEIRQAAASLKAAVQTKIAALNDAAQKAAEAGNKYDAYALYVQLNERYKGFDIPPEAKVAQKDLSIDAGVKQAQQAKKTLDGIRRSLATGKAGARKQAATQLKKIVADMAGNSVGEEAQELLSQVE